MKRTRVIFSWSIAIATLAAAAFSTTLGATPSRSTGELTVVPPAYFVGTAGNDVLYGTPRNDVLLGRGGNDRVYGLGRNDVLRGGNGNDVLWGGSGHDHELGSRGADLIHARDGQRDWIDGGPGFDTAWVDRYDVVTHVERVYRR